MDSLHASIIINKPVREVFEYAASPINGPAFIPNLNENINIAPENPSLGQKFDWRFNLLGVDIKGSAEVTAYEPPHKVVLKTSGDSNSTWNFTFEDVDGKTRVSAWLEYDVVESALQRITNRVILQTINQKNTELMLDNLKTILET